MATAMTTSQVAYHGTKSPGSRLAELQHAIDHAAHLLPAQGPISVFIHHNTLHAFEHLPFAEAVLKGARLFGSQPYLSEDRFRQDLARDRIRRADLDAVLREDLGPKGDEPILRFGSRFDLRLAMLRYPVRLAPETELRWFISQTDALRSFRDDVPAATRVRYLEETRHWVMRDLRDGSRLDAGAAHHADRRARDAFADLFRHFGAAAMERWSEKTWESFSMQALWRICRDGVHGVRVVSPPHDEPIRRHRDVLLDATGEDSDLLVNGFLIRFCAAYLDQGFSPWPLPERERGFFACFSALYRQPFGPPDTWLRGLKSELERIEQAGIEPLDAILESLDQLGVPQAEWDDFLTATMLSLRGWAGMINQIEERADRVVQPIRTGSLIEYLAVRLLLDRLALTHVARNRLGATGPLSQLRETLGGAESKHPSHTVDQRAFLVYQVAQALGWAPAALHRLEKRDWSLLVGEIEAFTSLERRRLFHLAYERRYRIQTLDATAVHSRRSTARVNKPRFQVVCCLDEREESFRRHLEEIAPDVETFGAAGFFSVAMYYRGAATAHFVPLCPIVVRPQHWVEEDVAYTFGESFRRRKRARRAVGEATHQLHVGSRTFFGGALLTAGLGVLASVPLVFRVLFPRLTARIRRAAHRLVEPPPPLTRLLVERPLEKPGPEEGHIGFTVEEMANISERILRDIGLTRGFARIVAFLGHGSGSLNNPHKSAYDCGACGGSSGGPNARAVSHMLNDPRIREILIQRGIELPVQTVFVGGFHNTCDDSVTWFDLDRLPRGHQREFDEIRQNIEDTCDRNAHERCRRFQSAPLDMSIPAARRHVEARSEDLSQTRPECGHATNALCYVGRRSRTRGLYLDRRAFLTSYDPTEDTPGSPILTRILQAVFPVCGGINLEYYFSYVDSPGWGCSTKLPHNVSALVGVMDGAASDLRTGLPIQMTEIHEPVRLLIILETTPAEFLGIMERNPPIAQSCRHDWVQVATLDPHSNRIHHLKNGRFEPYEPESRELPSVRSSPDWYRGWRDHLGFAVVEGPLPHA